MPKVTLEADQLWKGSLYLAGSQVEVPEELAIALNLSPKSEAKKQKAATKEEQPSEAPTIPALTLLNTAQEPKELTPLPKIGDGAAKKLLANRPESGYESLEQAAELNPELAKAPFKVDWSAIQGWEPVS